MHRQKSSIMGIKIKIDFWLSAIKKAYSCKTLGRQRGGNKRQRHQNAQLKRLVNFTDSLISYLVIRSTFRLHAQSKRKKKIAFQSNLRTTMLWKDFLKVKRYIYKGCRNDDWHESENTGVWLNHFYHFLGTHFFSGLGILSGQFLKKGTKQITAFTTKQNIPQ